MRLPDLLPLTTASSPPEPEPDAPLPQAPPSRHREGPRSHLQLASPRPRAAPGPELRSARPGGFTSPSGARALEQATALLTRSLMHPAITDADAAAVLATLAPLDREALLFALSGLEGRGLLSRFVAEQDPDTRAGFISLLLERRILVESPPNPPPSAPLAPPALPSTVAAVPTHLPPLDGLAHGENVQRAVTYRQEREAYLERYTEWVGKASSVGELELLGPPVTKARFVRAGSSQAAEDRTRSLNRLTRGATDQDHRRAYEAYGDRKLLLAGQRPAMTMRGTFSASVTDRLRQVGLGTTVGPEGVRFQPEVGVSIKATSLKIQAPGDGGPPVVSAGVRVGNAGASLASDGTLKLELGPLRVETTPGSGQVGIGVGPPVALARVLPFEGSAGISLQLADPQRAAANALSPGAPEAPAALTRGQRWGELSPEHQEALKSAGVRETFWDAVIGAGRPTP